MTHNRPTRARRTSSHRRLISRDFLVRTIAAVGVALSLYALFLLLWYSIYALFVLFGGILVAVLLRGLSDFVSDVTGLPHGRSLLLVLVALLGAFALVVWLSAPAVYEQSEQLVDRLPASVQTLRARLETTVLGRFVVTQSPRAQALVTGRTPLFGSLSGMVSGTLGALITFVVVLFTGLFLASNPRLYIRGVLRLIPKPQRDRTGEVLGAIGYTLKWWLIGQAIAMVVIGTATWLGLWLLGIPLAMVLGLIAGMFNFIPNFGPLFSMVPAVLLALAEYPDSPEYAGYVVLLFLLLQNLEGYLLTPLIQRRAVHLPPALTIGSQLLLGILVGPIGLALATPLAAVALVAVKMLYVEDVLHDRIKTPMDEPDNVEVDEVKEVADDLAERPKESSEPRRREDTKGVERK